MLSGSFDVWAGKIKGLTVVPGQEGEELIERTEAYYILPYSFNSGGPIYKDCIYARLTTRDGNQFFVRKYNFQEVVDRIGISRYERDKLTILEADVFTDREKARKKLSTIQEELEARYKKALDATWGEIETDPYLYDNYKKFKRRSCRDAVIKFVEQSLKDPLSVKEHFWRAVSYTKTSEHGFIERHARVRLKDEDIHLCL